MDIGQVAVAEDLSIGMLFLQATQQCEQCLFLHGRASVGRFALLVETTFVADAERVPVVAFGMGTDQILVARLVDLAVAGNVIVVARESELFLVPTDEGCHGKVLVAARG